MLGAVRLNKALWNTDVLSYKTNGTPITGERYVKRAKGPVPKHILATLRLLEERGDIVVREPEYKFDTRKFISLTAPRAELLSDEEREMARAVLSYVCGRSANQISEESHISVWEEADEGEEIPLSATLVSNEGEYTKEVYDWANAQVVEIARERGVAEA